MDAFFILGHDMAGHPLVEYVVGATCKMFVENPALYTDVTQWLHGVAMCVLPSLSSTTVF